jgi:hypothetical protein
MRIAPEAVFEANAADAAQRRDARTTRLAHAQPSRRAGGHGGGPGMSALFAILFVSFYFSFCIMFSASHPSALNFSRLKAAVINLYLDFKLLFYISFCIPKHVLHIETRGTHPLSIRYPVLT